MPASLLQDRVDAAWPAISKEVAEALRFETGTLVRKIIPVIGSDSGHGIWGPWQGLTPIRRRVATKPTEVVASEHRFAIDYDALESPPLPAIKRWTETARTLELTDLLNRIVKPLIPVQMSLPLPSSVPAGWGQPRFLHSGLPRDYREALAVVAEEKLITVPLPRNIKALVFRLGGGLSIKAGPDMELGWIPAIDGIELVLITQATLINADGTNVTALKIDL
jgi:hypothetical protein